MNNLKHTFVDKKMKTFDEFCEFYNVKEEQALKEYERYVGQLEEAGVEEESEELMKQRYKLIKFTQTKKLPMM